GGSICADGCGFKRTDLPKNIHIWSKNFKSTGREYGQGVAVDPQGNMLVTGYFTGKVDFGGQELTAVGEDLFVVKLSPRGELIWVRNYSNTGNEHGLGIAVDSKGCVLVTGHFDGDVVFGDYIFTSTGTDLFVLKLEPEAGAVIWARNLKSSGSEEGHGVAVDDQENVLVTGYFDGVRDADGNGLIANGTDLFVVKLDPKEGTVIWAHNFKSKGNQHGMGIAADLKGNVFLTGYFDGKVTFGEFKLEAKGIDLFVIKLEPKEGTVIWAHNYKSEGNEHGMGIAVDPKGHVILTGYFDGKVTFGEFKLSAEGMDMFVVKLEPETDKVLWANNYTPTGDNYGMAVAVDDGGNVFVTGYFNAKMIVGELNKKPSGEDMFVLKLNPEGKEIWVKQFGGAGNQRG
ncbi:MAG: PQQ-binding-like beta-propeller repeat protein, partial [Planctomycetes bacterium]|nr:PQQ-binding-like beta-propeller repeat protein [Planctomycetota bacterium]